jgi:hypothetical protein
MFSEISKYAEYSKFHILGLNVVDWIGLVQDRYR